MAGSEFDGNIDLYESFRFIDFHPIAQPKREEQARIFPQSRDGSSMKHVVIPIKAIDILWTEESGCFINFKMANVSSSTSADCTCAISPSEYKTICQRLGISGDNP